MKALHLGTAGRTRTECSRSTLKPLRTAALTELAYLKRAEWSVKGAAFMDTMPVQQQATGKGRPCSRRCSEYPWCMKGFTVLRHVPRHPEVIETAAAAGRAPPACHPTCICLEFPVSWISTLDAGSHPMCPIGLMCLSPVLPAWHPHKTTRTACHVHSLYIHCGGEDFDA